MKKKSSGLMSNLRVESRSMQAALREENIKQKLGGLFYTEHKPNEEVELIRYQFEQEEEERFGLHASSIIDAVGRNGLSKSFCFREHVLSLFYKRNEGERRGNPANLQRIFEEGKAIELKWQRLFIRGEIGVKEKMDITRFFDKYDLQYTPDAEIEIDGKTYTVEIKSMNDNQYTTQKGHKKGEKQLKVYLYFNMLQNGLEGVQRGFVLRENKNNQEYDIVLIEMDEQDFEADESFQIIMDALEQIQYYKRQFENHKRIPPRHEDCTNEYCPKAKRCPMREACYGSNRRKLNE